MTIEELIQEPLCPICLEPSVLIAYAQLAPWIEDLLSLDKTTSSLHECKSCEFSYFSYRYSDDEMEKLYSGYRSDSYLKARSSWEFWYSKRINDFWLQPNNVSIRRNRIIEHLKHQNLDITSISSCLDFGGDEGQFAPEHIPRDKNFILDLSGKSDSEKFTYIKNVESLPAPVELVLCCMTLEHVASPRRIIQDLAQSTYDYVYLEVPHDSFKVSKFHKTTFYKRYLRSVRKSKTLFVLLDFITGVIRNYLGLVPWFGIVKQSEHINYFSSLSILKLGTIAGLTGETKVFSSANVGGIRLGQSSTLLRV